MTDTTAAKREKNFTRSYSDASGAIAILHDDAEVINVNVDALAEKTVKSAVMRYATDIMVGVGNAMIKAGKTADEAYTAMQAAWTKLADGTFPFRSASGDGGLSIEEEMSVIAETIVSLGKSPDKETALAKVQALYAKVKVAQRKVKGEIVDGVQQPDSTKAVDTRPDYNALKNVPQIKAALAVASKSEGNLDSLLA